MIKEKSKNFVSFFIFVGVDFFSFLLSFYLAFLARELSADAFASLEKITTFPIAHYYQFWWMPALFLAVFWYEGLYGRMLVFWSELRLILRSLTVAVVTLVVIVTLSKQSEEISRLMLVQFWLISLFVFPFFRMYLKALLIRLGLYGKKALLISKNSHSSFLENIVGKKSLLGYKIYKQMTPEDVLVGGLKTKDHSTVIVDEMEHDKLVELYEILQKKFKDVIYIPENNEMAFVNTETQSVLEDRVFLVRIKNNLQSSVNKLIKRLFDIAIVVLIMPFFLLLLGVVALLIKLDSRGRVFFIQERVGQDMGLYRCIKFRTMYEDNDKILEDYLEENHIEKEQWKEYKKLKSKDPRVTKVGAVLRRYSLDELPQIINVAKGEMSLVGPRPYLEKEIIDMEGKERMITISKPGITGLWQISGRNKLSFKKRLELDEWYVRNWSLWLDFVIILKTFKVVLIKEGAY
ncbi:MAG: exopolysaccharide biosynthesis polyprenyl glycosylphosphotransferase [Campylobacterales bacterium]